MNKEFIKRTIYGTDTVYVSKSLQFGKIVPAVMKCPECKKISKYKVNCPFCGKMLEENPVEYLYDGGETWGMSAYNIYTDEENGMVSAVIYLRNVKSLSIKNLILVKYYKIRIALNTRTGQAYVMEMRTQNGRKSRLYKAPKLLNFTLSGVQSPFFYYANHWLKEAYSSPQFVEDMRQALSNVYGRQIPKYDGFKDCSNFTRQNPFFYLVLWNYMPGMSPVFYQTMNRIIYHYFISNAFIKNKRKHEKEYNKYYRRLLKQVKKADLTKYGTILEKFGIPETKATKRELFKNPLFVQCYNYFQSVGFNNHDNTMILSTKTDTMYAAIENMANRNVQPEKFIRQLIEVRGEQRTRKAVEQYPFTNRTMSDCIKQYNLLLEKTGEKKLDPTLLKGSIKEVDEKISRVYRKLYAREESQKFEWDDHIKNLESEADGIRFTLPEESYDLFETGEAMDICVYSYTSSVLMHDCIVVLMTENDRHVGCIELIGETPCPGYSVNLFYLNQVKGPGNEPLKGRYKDVFLKWMQDLSEKGIGIRTDECIDYQELLGLKENNNELTPL